jgi:uncharacterized protein (DUF305 family)
VRPRLRLLAAAGLAVAAATVAGCGGPDDPAAPAAPANAAASADPAAAKAKAGGDRHNADDVMFLQMMVSHHGEGTAMAELGAEKGGQPQLTQLAGAIAATQKDEAATMRTWLRSWDEPTRAAKGASAHAAHGGLPATGPAQIAALKKARGEAFDTSFLNLMVGHQGAAVEMADRELENGVNADARALAKRIVDSRNAEIEMMLKLLGA